MGLQIAGPPPIIPAPEPTRAKTGAGMGAHLAELVDAADLKFASRKGVPVRVRQWAPQTGVFI